MTKEERNKETVLNAIAAFNQQDLDLYWSYHTEDTTSWEVYFEEPLTKAQMSEFVPQLWKTFPDWHIETKTILAMGDKVVVENVMSATFINEYRGQPPTGKKFSVGECVFFDMQDGKIKDVRVYLDRKTQDAQMGITPGKGGI